MFEAVRKGDIDTIAVQVIDFHKTAFISGFTIASFFQEQVFSGIQHANETNTWMPAEGRRQIDSYLAACTQIREQFQSVVVESFERAEAVFQLRR